MFCCNFPYYYPHNKARVGDVVIVGAVGVHQLDVERELGQRDVVVNVVVGGVQPLHLDLKGIQSKI